MIIRRKCVASSVNESVIILSQVTSSNKSSMLSLTILPSFQNEDETIAFHFSSKWGGRRWSRDICTSLSGVFVNTSSWRQHRTPSTPRPLSPWRISCWEDTNNLMSLYTLSFHQTGSSDSHSLMVWPWADLQLAACGCPWCPQSDVSHAPSARPLTVTWQMTMWQGGGH